MNKAYAEQVRQSRFRRAFRNHAEEMFELVMKVVIGKTAGWTLIREATAIINAVNTEVNTQSCTEEVNGCGCGYYYGAARRSVHAAWKRWASSSQGQAFRM